MKKKLFQLSLLLAAFAVLTLGSCKKTDDADDSISAEDASNVSSTLNSATDDATNAASGIQSFSGKTEGAMQLCGATVDTTNLHTDGSVLITFNGQDCSGRISRTGTITATIANYTSGTRWKDAGAVLTLVFNAVTVTNLNTNKTVVLNGTHVHTNVSGGLAWKIMNNMETGTVTHHHTASNFSLTFDDGTSRIWSVDRTRTFSNVGGVQSVTISSDHSEGGVSNVDAWGTNRLGTAFTNQITTPIVASTTCGLNKPTQGEVTHHVGSKNIAVVLGVNASGTAYDGNCSNLYGFKVTHTRNGHERSRVVSYWF